MADKCLCKLSCSERVHIFIDSLICLCGKIDRRRKMMW